MAPSEALRKSGDAGMRETPDAFRRPSPLTQGVASPLQHVPSRREFLALLAAASAVLPRAGRALAVPGAPALAGSARPSPAQLAWQDLEVGMFIHFAPNTWQEQEYDDHSTPLAAFTPDIDTDQWAEVAVALGARYVILVAKHVGGFCLWQTETNGYSIQNTPWRNGKGDVMADLAASCERRGLKLGVYLSPRDDSFGAGGSGRCRTPEEQARYDAVYRTQLTELLTRYGPIMELWLDGSSVVPTADIVQRHAPDAMIFQGPQATIRWVGNEDGFAPYPAWNSLASVDAATGIATALHGDPDGDVWMPLEVDVSIRRPNWFWSTTNHVNLLSLEALLEIYYRSVGRGAQLLLNFTPDRTGHIPEADAARAAEFGSEIRRRFGSSVAEVRGQGSKHLIELRDPRRIDHVIIAEHLVAGERVRGYRLRGRMRGRWIELGEGTAVGHERIHPVGPADLTAVQLIVTRSAGEPVIRRFAVYDTGAAPPAGWNQPAGLWGDDAVGSWSGREVEIDLTQRIDAATQYRLRFVPQAEDAVEVEEVSLLVGGIAQPAYVRRAAGRRDLAILTIPGLGQSFVLRARLKGAKAGSVLLRRM